MFSKYSSWGSSNDLTTLPLSRWFMPRDVWAVIASMMFVALADVNFGENGSLTVMPQ